MKTKTNKILSFILCAVFSLCFFGLVLTYTTAKAERVTHENAVEIYQLAPDSGNLLEGYVIKTANGKLIVVDGGMGGADNPTTIAFDSYLPSALRAISGVGQNDYFEVEAWFISHAHTDHFYALAKMLYAYRSDVTSVTYNDDLSDTTADKTFATDTNFKIKNFYFDIPDENETNSANWRDVSVGPLNILKQGLTNYANENDIEVTDTYYDDLNGAVINADAIKSGLNLEIDGVRIEVLQTWSTSDGNANDNSTIMRLWVGGQSLLFLNDAGVSAGNRLIDTYGEGYLKSDIVQMAHHGQAGVDRNVYDAVNAKVRLWAANSYVWSIATTAEVRTWVGLNSTAFKANTANDLVASLYPAYPTNITSVDAWKAVIGNMKIDMPCSAVYPVENNFISQDGAGIRLNENSTGIRFKATMASYDTDAKYGFVIVPKYYLTTNNITENYIPKLTEIYGEKGLIKLTSDVLKEGDEYFIQGSIANVKYSNLTMEFTGIAYEYLNGVYNYAHFDSIDDVSRSVFNVATKAYNKDLSDDNAFDNDEITVIDDFIKKSLALKNGISEEQFNLGQTATPTLEFEGQTLDAVVGINKAFKLNSSFDIDAVTFTYDETQLIVDAQKMTLKPLVVGEITLTASCYGITTTLTVNGTEAGGYLASFDSETYLDKVYKPSNANLGNITTEWLPNYRGETGVMKITFINDSAAGADAAAVIDLMGAYGTGYTIRYMLETGYNASGAALSNVLTLRFRVADNGVMSNGPNKESKLTHDTWYTDYVEVDSAITARNSMSIYVFGGGGVTLYVSAILDGDKVSQYELASKLSGQEIASFDQEEYTSLIKHDMSQYTSSTIPVIEHLESYDGEVGVVKLGSTNNTANNASKFFVKLPKFHSGSFTIRFMIKSTEKTSATLVLSDPSTGANTVVIDTNGKTDKWINFKATFTNAGDQINIVFCNTVGGQNELYIAGVWDGTEVGANLTDGYVAEFDHVLYTDMVTKHQTYTPDELTAKLVSNEQGESGVMKVFASKASAGSWAFNVKLPKAHTGTYTIRFMFGANTTSTGVTTIMDANGHAQEFAGPATQYIGTWKTIAVNSVAGDTLTFYCYAKEASAVEICLSFIMEGDKVEDIKNQEFEELVSDLGASLESGYIANFNSATYEKLVSASARPARGASAVKAEYLSEYSGEEDVLKITSTANGMGIADVVLRLPKTCSTGMTVRFMVKSTAKYIYWLSPSEKDSLSVDDGAIVCTSGLGAKNGVWQTAYINYTSSTHPSTILNVLELLVAGDTANSVTEIYFSFVMDGNQVANIKLEEAKEQILSTLPDGYLAKYDVDAYTSLIDTSSFNERKANHTAEIVETAELGKVMKVTTVTNGLGCGDLILYLPKSSTTGKISVYMMVDTADAKLINGGKSGAVRFWSPGTTSGMYDKNGHIATLLGPDALTKEGQWTAITINYASTTVKNKIDIQVSGTANTTYNFYFAYICDGDFALDARLMAMFNNQAEEFKIFADGPPNPDNARLDAYREANFNYYVMTEDLPENGWDETVGSMSKAYKDSISRAKSRGLKVIMRNMTNAPTYFDNISAEDIEFLKANVDGFFMCDEPYYSSSKAHDIDDAKKLADWYNTHFAGKLFHINLLQSYGMDLTNSGVDFETYVNSYVEKVLKNVNGPKTLSTDYYPLTKDYKIKSEYLHDYFIIANAVKTLKSAGHNVETNYCIQLLADSGLNIREVTTRPEVNFQANMSMAFGAHSLEYYKYVGSDLTDTTSELYSIVKKINAEMNVLAKALLCFDWNGAKFYQTQDSANTVVLDLGMQLDGFAKLSSFTSTKDAIVSEFTSAELGNAYMAVNYTEPSATNGNNNVTFNFTGATKAIVIIDGQKGMVDITANTLSLTLGVGQSAFVYPV